MARIIQVWPLYGIGANGKSDLLIDAKIQGHSFELQDTSSLAIHKLKYSVLHMV